MRPSVIKLGPADAERFALVRKRMLADAPWAFVSTPEDDPNLDLGYLRDVLGQVQNEILAIEARDVEPVTGAPADEVEGQDLVAAAGIFRMKSPKFSHRARLWGVFVSPECRGRGLGRLVISAAVELAKSWKGVEFIDLGVSENSPDARRLYESVGFEEWGREPEATHYDGHRYDEIYMSLRVRARVAR